MNVVNRRMKLKQIYIIPQITEQSPQFIFNEHVQFFSVVIITCGYSNQRIVHSCCGSLTKIDYPEILKLFFKILIMC